MRLVRLPQVRLLLQALSSQVNLAELVADFARGVEAADSRHPRAVNVRSKQPYQIGLGPHTEARTVALVLEEMRVAHGSRYESCVSEVPYVGAPRKKCDLCWGEAPDYEWAIEIKMIRMLGDNGKPNDNLPTHILSPYPGHRSALTDCEKLLASGLGKRKAVLMYGYDYPDWPLEPLVEAFEKLARDRVSLAERVQEPFQGLVHPVHQQGAVLAWEVR